MIYKFQEALTDYLDTFILGDPFTMLEFVEANKLSPNLQNVFTTTDFAEQAIETGVMTYMGHLGSNFAFTILFNFTEKALLKTPTHHTKGHLVKTTGYISLYTWRYFADFVEESANKIIELSNIETDFTKQTVEGRDVFCKNAVRQTVKVKAGNYAVEILVGTFEEEPTIEFLLKETINESILVDVDELTNYVYAL